MTKARLAGPPGGSGPARRHSRPEEGDRVRLLLRGKLSFEAEDEEIYRVLEHKQTAVVQVRRIVLYPPKRECS